MKILKYILFSLLLTAAMPTEMQAKRMKMPKMFMFGFSASFQDSIIYMTDVQEIEAHGMTPRPSSCWVDNIIPTSSRTTLPLRSNSLTVSVW